MSEYRVAIGDLLTIQVFPYAQFSDVVVQSNGTIHVGHAQSIPVVGCTLAQIQQLLHAEMMTWYQHGVVSVAVSEIRGHYYTILGKVVDKGRYTLDRPWCLLSALARARGIEVGLQDGTTVEIADLDHALLVRQGELIPIDFRALLQRGDMRYNIFLHAGDMLYFPSNISETVQVFGAVTSPGSQAYSSGMHLTAVLARRGGLTDEAWLRQILVVRGNLAQPQVFCVNYQDILLGKIPDFSISPGDVVHVADRPYQDVRKWTRAVLRMIASTVGGMVGRDIAQGVLP